MLLLLTACWVQSEDIPFELVTFENTHSDGESGYVVETFEYDLACPDGENARFYTVHDPDAVGPVATALVLHSSVFDYVLAPRPGTPPEGNHYAAGLGDNTRLHQGWGIAKVWETLGMYPTIDANEVNTGSLPSVLVDKDITGVYPINCWGDLWHNESSVQPNDEAGDLFSRNGHAFAVRVARLISDAEFRSVKGIELGFEPDLNRVMMMGLGDGTTGLVDLLRREDTPHAFGVLFDAPVDDLSIWAEDSQFSDRAQGLERIFNYDPTDPDEDRRIPPDWIDHSIQGLVLDGVLDGRRTAVLYSDADPFVPFPNTHYDGLLAAVGDDSLIWASNTQRSEHVFTNSDSDLARKSIEFLLTGNKPGGN